MANQYTKKIQLREAEAEYREHRKTHTGLGEIFRVLEAEGYKEETLIECFSVVRDALGLIPSITSDVDSQFAPLFKDTIEQLNRTIYEHEVGKQEVKKLKSEYHSKIATVEHRYRREFEEKCNDLPRRERSLEGFKEELSKMQKRLLEKETELLKRETDLDKREEKIHEMETPESRDMVRRLDLFLHSVSKTEKTERAIAYGVGAILSGKPVEFEKGAST